MEMNSADSVLDWLNWYPPDQITMLTEELEYTTGKAGAEDLLGHLLTCNPDFIASLRNKTDLPAYARKLAENSVTFEAWDRGKLVGLIAAYFNDPHKASGFVSNVSTASGYAGKGIASRLMDMCIRYGTDRQFPEISLEVEIGNRPALALYAKFGFEKKQENGGLPVMNRILPGSKS